MSIQQGCECDKCRGLPEESEPILQECLQDLRRERNELLAGYRELRITLEQRGGCACGECLEIVNAALAKWGER